MSRWQPNPSERLEKSALELFAKQGFGATTVPQITAHAGLTTRTFFRYFADKREVLFAQEDELPALVHRIIAEAAPELSPMEIIVGAFDRVAEAQFANGADYFRLRHSVISSDAGLHERELQKLSAVSQAIHRGLEQRGVDSLTSELVAHATMTVFSVSIGTWLSRDDGVELATLLHETLGRLRSLMADPRWQA